MRSTLVKVSPGLARSGPNIEPTDSTGTKLRPTETDRGLCSVFGQSHFVLRYFGPVSVFMANFFGRSSGHDVLNLGAPGWARLCPWYRLLETLRPKMIIYPLFFEWLQFIFRFSLRFQALGPVRSVSPKTEGSGRSQANSRPKMFRSVRSLPLFFGLARMLVHS